MTGEVIENHFRVWADPDAAWRGESGADVQGGHGNGGKCYMSQMFEDYAYIETVKSGLYNMYGVEGNSTRFGYIPNPDDGKNRPVDDVKESLKNALKPLACKLQDLPKQVLDVLKKTKGYTLVCGVGPKDIGKKIESSMYVEMLRQHPQMIQSIGLTKIFIIVNGKLRNPEPLVLKPIPPHRRGTEPRVVQVPPKLKDPKTGQKCSTNAGETDCLILLTSEKSMRRKLKVRHNITYRANESNIGYRSIPEFDVQSSYAVHIYGECKLSSLEDFKTNNRHLLAESALTRAVEDFVRREIEKYAKEFEEFDRKKRGKEEKNAVSEMNAFLNKWKDQFLKELMKGVGGPGDGTGIPDTPTPLPAGVPSRIEIELPYRRAGIGVAFRPRVQFYNSDGNQVRAIPFRWVSEDANVALVNEDLNVIDTYSLGVTDIFAEAIEGKLRSSSLQLSVVNIHNIEIVPAEVEVAAGGRSGLSAICTLADRTKVADVCLTWTENDSSIARVSSSGTVFGIGIGTTNVVAGDDRCLSDKPSLITVLPPTERTGSGSGGRGYPRILVSGDFDLDPDSNEFRHFASDEPPVLQLPRDVDRNIFWINSASPLANYYLDSSIGFGYDSLAWRMYHVERFVDIVIQIALSVDDEIAESMSSADWNHQRGYKAAQIQTEIIESLSGFIEEGSMEELS